MRHWSRALLLVLPLIASLRVSGQGAPAQPSADDLQRAAALFAKSDWQGAFDAYSSLAQKYPTHPLSRFRVGASLIGLGRYAEAESHLREGERLGVPAAQAGFRLAQALARQQKADAAITELMRSAAAGLPVAPTTLASDPHLASLTSHPRWSAVLVTVDSIARPCMHDPRFREFDFWVGDWDVKATTGAPPGPASRNNITLEDNGCVVMEHYTTPNGFEGQSFNIFDRSYGLWRQTWIDNSGGQHDYRGNLKGRDMVLVGDTPAAGGRLGRVPTRLTLFHISKDSVRQFSEVSPDSGKTWRTAYDLMYVRRPARP